MPDAGIDAAFAANTKSLPIRLSFTAPTTRQCWQQTGCYARLPATSQSK
jgi:hypothetical protein